MTDLLFCIWLLWSGGMSKLNVWLDAGVITVCSRAFMTCRIAPLAENKGEKHRNNSETLLTFMKSEIMHARNAHSYKLTYLCYQASFLRWRLPWQQKEQEHSAGLPGSGEDDSLIQKSAGCTAGELTWLMTNWYYASLVDIYIDVCFETVHEWVFRWTCKQPSACPVRVACGLDWTSSWNDADDTPSWKI